MLSIIWPLKSFLTTWHGSNCFWDVHGRKEGDRNPHAVEWRLFLFFFFVLPYPAFLSTPSLFHCPSSHASGPAFPGTCTPHYPVVVIYREGAEGSWWWYITNERSPRVSSSRHHLVYRSANWAQGWSQPLKLTKEGARILHFLIPCGIAGGDNNLIIAPGKHPTCRNCLSNTILPRHPS